MYVSLHVGHSTACCVIHNEICIWTCSYVICCLVAKPVLNDVNKRQKRNFFNKKMTLSWNHTQPPPPTAADDVHPPRFDCYTVEIQKQHDEHQDEQLQEVNDKWKEPDGLYIDQQNRIAYFKLKRGTYQFRVSANFERGESVSSEAKEISVPKSK